MMKNEVKIFNRKIGSILYVTKHKGDVQSLKPTRKVVNTGKETAIQDPFGLIIVRLLRRN